MLDLASSVSTTPKTACTLPPGCMSSLRAAMRSFTFLIVMVGPIAAHSCTDARDERKLKMCVLPQLSECEASIRRVRS